MDINFSCQTAFFQHRNTHCGQQHKNERTPFFRIFFGFYEKKRPKVRRFSDRVFDFAASVVMVNGNRLTSCFGDNPGNIQLHQRRHTEFGAGYVLLQPQRTMRERGPTCFVFSQKGTSGIRLLRNTKGRRLFTASNIVTTNMGAVAPSTTIHTHVHGTVSIGQHLPPPGTRGHRQPP